MTLSDHRVGPPRRLMHISFPFPTEFYTSLKEFLLYEFSYRKSCTSLKELLCDASLKEFEMYTGDSSL